MPLDSETPHDSPVAGRSGWGSRRAGAAAPNGARTPLPAPPSAAPACTGAQGARILSAVPSSTISPRYMTITRSAMCRTTARSWLMKRYARPRSTCSRVSSSRICPRTETSSEAVRLVEQQHLRPTASARAIAHALAFTAAELARVAAGELRAESDLGEQVVDGGRALIGGQLGVQSQRLLDRLADGHPRVERGRGIPGRPSGGRRRTSTAIPWARR